MDYIHYIARRVTTMAPSKKPACEDIRIGLHNDSGGFLRPEYHQTRMSAWPVKQIGRGDTIWLVSQLSSPWGVLPPSLDARIDVGSVISCNCGVTRFIAKRSSVWHLMSDSSAFLATLRIAVKNGNCRDLIDKGNPSVGQALQSIKLLEPISAERLRLHADSLMNSPYEFISYRHVDGTKRAFALVQELLECNASVYWDRWNLPRRLTERREEVNNSTLTRHLHSRIRKADRVWGVLSPKYQEPKRFAAKEMHVAMEVGNFLPW